MNLVKIDTRRITDWNTFHDVFSEAFGFPDFYGRNMDAWIDCMTDLDDPSTKMSKIHTMPDGIIVLQLENVENFARRCPEQYAAIVECTAFVNLLKVEIGEEAVLTLAFNKGV
jgi:RNAse (barnase) inhibitor barstar